MYDYVGKRRRFCLIIFGTKKNDNMLVQVCALCDISRIRYGKMIKRAVLNSG